MVILINISITNIIFLSFQLPCTSFYSAQPRTSRRLATRAMEEQRTLRPYIMPNDCGDSDIEVEDELEDIDDDDLDPDFLMDLNEDLLTPTASGKH